MGPVGDFLDSKKNQQYQGEYTKFKMTWISFRHKTPTFHLVGGFNPIEKYECKIGSLPQVAVKIKKSLKPNTQSKSHLSSSLPTLQSELPRFSHWRPSSPSTWPPSVRQTLDVVTEEGCVCSMFEVFFWMPTRIQWMKLKCIEKKRCVYQNKQTIYIVK